MYRGIIETESLIKKDILDEVEIIKSYSEEHFDEIPPIWTINKITVSEDKFDLFIKKLTKSMIKGWYSLLWNDSFVYVIFKNKIFKILNKKPWIRTELTSVVNYALNLNIQKKYFDNLRKSIDEW